MKNVQKIGNGQILQKEKKTPKNQKQKKNKQIKKKLKICGNFYMF